MPAPTFDLLREYNNPRLDDTGKVDSETVIDRNYICASPSWCIAVIRLGKPVSYSRVQTASNGKVVEGAFERKEHPLIITDDVVALNINSSKSNHTTSLSAQLKDVGTNYLARDVMLPGDWVMAWCFNNNEKQADVVERIKAGKPCNDPEDGLKFIGRVHDIRKHIDFTPDGQKVSGFQLQCIGFEELDTQFFYDYALASSAAQSSLRRFMAQMGLDFSQWANQEQQKAGQLKDNADYLIPQLVNIIVGKGAGQSFVNDPVGQGAANAAEVNEDVAQRMHFNSLRAAPQANKDAPYAYLVPRTVGLLLGLTPEGASKEGIFGYADLLNLLIGVQKYEPHTNPYTGMLPANIDSEHDNAAINRVYLKDKLKGTFLPVNPTFVNQPLYQILQQYLNPALNEMYTTLRVDQYGAIMPHIVVRQIPFSTESVKEKKTLPLTRFMSLPRWKVSPVMVTAPGFSYGRSNATRINMLHIYGDASAFAANRTVTNQLVRNPPIFDEIDIQRSGIRMMSKTVNCALEDVTRPDGARDWMEAIADWTFGSHLTLNGTLNLVGIQSPIAVGDNIEFQGLVFHIESISHSCNIAGDGRKQFRTILQLSNGMPVDQEQASPDFPVYPGFTSMRTETSEQVPNPEFGRAVAEALGASDGSYSDTLDISDRIRSTVPKYVDKKTATFTDVSDDNIGTAFDPGHTFLSAHDTSEPEGTK